MPAKPHLLIAAAVPAAQEASHPPQPLPPNLRALLASLALDRRIECDEDSPATPLELALAEAHGLRGAPGRIPWAAFLTGTVGRPCAWVRPCHWQVGADHILLAPADQLALDEETSRELMMAMAPYFLEDGITLEYREGLPAAWLGLGEPFRDLETVSMERAAGRRLTPSFFNTAGTAAALLRRLQNEMQMLLYTHPATEARQREGLAPINSFWIIGAGELSQPLLPTPGVLADLRLQAPQLLADPAAHARAWREVDADCCAALLHDLRAGREVRLTLCGERAAQTWGPARSSALRRAANRIGLQRPSLAGFKL